MAASHSWSRRPNAPALQTWPPIPKQQLQLQTTFYHADQRVQRGVYPVPHVLTGPPVPQDVLSTQMGAEVESKFGFIFRQLGLMVEENKTMLRTDGRWQFAPDYEVLFEIRRVIAAVLRELPEAPEDLIRQHAEHIGNGSEDGRQFLDILLTAASHARSMGKDAARAVQTCRPPVKRGSMLLEIDLVVAPTGQVDEDAANLHIPVPVLTLTDQQITEGAMWSTIASNCQNGAFVEVTSQSWERHGKLQSPNLLLLHEARQQHFPQGGTMYFYDGSLQQRFGAVRGLHCYWFQKSCLVAVKELLLEEKLRKVNSEKNALMAHSTTSSSVVWVRELARKDGTIIAKSRQDPEGEEELERAFKVESPQDHPRLNDLDDLAKAIKQTNPDLKDIAPRHIYIYLRSKEAGEWQRIKGASTSLRQNTSEHDCYGFLPWRPT